MTSNARELAQIPSTSSGRRNLAYNGAMTVAQRGTSETSASGYGSVDRWYINEVTDGAVTASQSTEAPDGFANSLKIDVTTADTSLASNQNFNINQRLEGQDLQHLKKGTSGALPVTISFWVRSNKTGTGVLEVKDSDNTRTINKSFTIDTADTWEKKKITFEGDTTGTLDNDNALSVLLIWWLAAGSTYTSGTLATSWEAQTNANRAVGVFNIMDSTSNNFYLTGVQLEVGSVATEFEHRSFGEELAACQRYYYMAADGSDGNQSGLGMSYGHSDTESRFVVDFPITMRTVPSLDNPTVTDGYRFIHGATSSSTAQLASSFTLPYTGWNTKHRMILGQSGLTDNNSGGRAGYVQVYNSSAYVAFDAEL